MAILTGFNLPIDMGYPYSNVGQFPYVSTSTDIYYYENASANYIRIQGTGFSYNSAGTPLSGTINTLTFYDAFGTLFSTVTGVGQPLTTLWNYFVANNWLGFAQLVASGNDAITGGSSDDYLYGWNGNDNINGGSGNDVVDGGAGADVMTCLLYTSDAADERSSVDLGGR